MRVLWLCNIMLPGIAGALGLPASHKEGWLTGLSDTLLQYARETEIELGVCFPMPEQQMKQRTAGQPVKGEAGGIRYYGFAEDTVHEECYDPQLEERLRQILQDYKPDLVHIFGTEFAHSLAMVKAFGQPRRTLVGLQGICYRCAGVYTADLPEHIVSRALFRDIVKRDTIRQQQEKFTVRGEREKEVLRLTGHVTGRTAFDRDSALAVNPKLTYHVMNETMRDVFYEGQWEYDACEKHSLFFSQGNYPLKGLHYGLEAAGLLTERYPDMKLYVAGDVITAYRTLKDKLKIGSYGKYLLELIHKYSLEDRVVFCGRLTAGEMKERYLRAHVFVSPSAMENSPNSVGEAMLLGMPVISSDRGGVTSMLEDGREGWLFPAGDAGALAACIDRVFTMQEAVQTVGRAASGRAHRTHNARQNYERLLELYREIVQTA